MHWADPVIADGAAVLARHDRTSHRVRRNCLAAWQAVDRTARIHRADGRRVDLGLVSPANRHCGSDDCEFSTKQG